MSKSKVEWKKEPEAQDYVGVEKFLTLICSDAEASQLIEQLREGDTLRTAWFDDALSLREKLALVPLYHLRGYAAWRLGMEDPEFWQQ